MPRSRHHGAYARAPLEHYSDLQVWLAFSYGIRIGREQLQKDVQTIVQRAKEASGAVAAALAVVSNGELQRRVTLGRLAEAMPNSSVLGDNLISQCIRSAVPQIRLEPVLEAFPEIGSLVYCPVRREGEVGAVLAVFSERTEAFNILDVRVLEQLAMQLSIRLGWDLPHIPEPRHPYEEIESQAPAEAADESAPTVQFATLSDSRPQTARTLAIAGLALGVGVVGVGGWMMRNSNVLTHATPTAQQPAAETSAPPPVLPAPPIVQSQQIVVEPTVIRSPRAGFEIKTVGAHDFVLIHTQGEQKYKVGRLNKPERIYIDISGWTTAPGQSTDAAAHNFDKLRFGTQGNKQRIVFELTKPAECLVVNSPDRNMIVIDLFEAGSEAAATPELR